MKFYYTHYMSKEERLSVDHGVYIHQLRDSLADLLSRRTIISIPELINKYESWGDEPAENLTQISALEALNPKDKVY
jgi:hypothetical protein